MTIQEIAGDQYDEIKYSPKLTDMVRDSFEGGYNLIFEKLLEQYGNIGAVLDAIAETGEDEVTILFPHWSLNQPTTNEYLEKPGGDIETYHWDWDECETLLGVSLFVSQYDDLCANPHGLEV